MPLLLTYEFNCVPYINGIRIPAEARDFSLLHSIHTGIESHTASYPMGTVSCYPGDKAVAA
jgi:hypothetical protein